jgi:hypothetical protein
MPRSLWFSLTFLSLAFAISYWTASPRHPIPSVHGQVLDCQMPVGGARVRFQGQCPSTSTGADGSFQLPRPAVMSRVTAWKRGFGIAGASPRHPYQLILKRLPDQDNEDYRWIDPTPNPSERKNCGNCHSEIYDEWVSSAHAHSASKPRFLNLLHGTDRNGRRSRRWSLADEHPLGAAVCALCHAPTSRDNSIGSNPRVAKPDRGVHCDYCHKVVDAPIDELGTLLGRDALQLLRPHDEMQLFFGPLDDALRDGEMFGYSPIYKESRYCASCHEGVLFGVHVYGTYSEWQQSPAFAKNQQCQHCHMKPTGALHNVAPGKGGIERDPRTLASHRLPGADKQMLGRSLSLAVCRSQSATRVEVEVKADQVGHRVPTGFVDRHLLLVVEGFALKGGPVTLRAGEVLPLSAGRDLAGKPGKLFAKQLLDGRGKGPVPFWLTPARLVDTRLIPDQADRSLYDFVEAPARLRVRLIYRKFWQEVADEKGWTNDEITVADYDEPNPSSH